jgi:GMP synthase (glutamine-hydrolysing)
MKIYVVDNGGQWTHKEWRVVKSLGVDSEIIDNDADFNEIKDADGWILSGGAPSIVDEISKLRKISDILNNSQVPVLGICIGAQFIALHFKGKVRKASHPEFGKANVNFFNQDSIFKNIPDNIVAWENHNDEIIQLPEDFTICANSENCHVQAFYSTSRPLFGVQFHPEVEHTQMGREMFKSYLELCKREGN